MDGLDSKALLLGRVDRSGRDRVGAPSSGSLSTTTAPDGLLASSEDRHLLTIAPNRSGRSRSCIIPNLLNYAGAAVVVDLDGEAYAATADARRRTGHTVVRLDPFGLAGPEGDALDPFDLMDGLGESNEPAIESACQDIADLIPVRSSLSDAEEYEAFGLLSALIGYCYAVPEKRSFDNVFDTFKSDDIIYSLAVVLDTVGKKIPKMSYSEIANFLVKDDRARGRILGKLTRFKSLTITEVGRCFKASTVPLSDLASGAPVTIYLVMPTERLAIHSVLLRIWIGTLLLGALRSSGESDQPMLFLLDHCAELGSFALLESILRIKAADKLRIWTFWHDVYQLRTTYPAGWPAFVSECAAVQVFGTKDAAASAEAEALLGLTASDVWSLGPGEEIVRLDGVTHRAWRLDADGGPA